MATNFPTSLDNLSNPAGSDPINNPSHAVQHANVNDAIEVLEAKVGVNNSAVTTSLDYRVKQLETNPTYTNEMAQDAVAAALAAGTHTNITINYNDTGNSISISAAAGYTNEEAVDAVAAALTAGSGISISYNDPANTITISLDSTIATKTYVDTAITSLGNTASTTYVPQSDVGNIDGVASLDGTGKVPDSQIPAGIARDSEVTSAISTEVTNRNSAISTAINNLINSAPGTLDTLGEIATALAADESAAAALTTVVNGKVSKAGGDIIQPSSASTVGLTIKSSASQTADLQQWLNSSGDLLGRFHPTAGLLVSSVSSTGGGGAPFMIFDSTNFSLYTNTASNKGLIIKGAASQTANLQEWQNSAGTVRTLIDSNGSFNTNANNNFNAASGFGGLGAFTNSSIVAISTNTASYIGLLVRGVASQTADLQQWQNSSGTVIANIGFNGAFSSNIQGSATSLLNISQGGSTKLEINQYGQSWNSTNSTFGSYYNTEGGTLPQVSILPSAAGTKGLLIRGATSQTANLQEWQTGAGSLGVYVTASGQLETGYFYTNFGGGSYKNNGLVTINPSNNIVPLVIAGAASQTSSLTEWKNSAGGVLLGIDSTGSLNIGSGSNNIWRIKNQTSTVLEWQPGQGFMFLPYGSSNRPVTIKGAASQTGNLTEWHNNNGDVLSKITSDGSLQVGSGAWTAINSLYGQVGVRTDGALLGSLSVGTGNAGVIGLVVKGAASQSANLQEWQNSAGTVLSKVDSTGAMFTITPADSTNTTQVATTAYVKNNIANLISSAPATLDTLNELATALGNDANFSTTVTNSIALKAPLASPTFTGTVSGITKTMVGLGSVDNTADIAKPISTATQTALDLKAALASPTFTGTPLAPTATSGTNTTQIATTAFVKTAIDTSVQPGAVYQTSAPSSPAVGQIWIDSDEDVTTFDSNIIRRKAITATAGQTVFTADLPFIDGFEQIFMNGLLLVKTTDYATSGGNTVTLTSGAAASDIIEIVSVTGANSISTYTQAETNALLAANTSVAPLSISANTTLLAKKRYFVTSASALTLTLPASPALNDEIQILDASGNSSTYNITVARNANKINGGSNNLIIDTNGGWYTLLYTGSTYGWKVG
jgi:hypothetical protein